MSFIESISLKSHLLAYIIHTIFFSFLSLESAIMSPFPYLISAICLFSAFVFICLARFINFIAVLKEFPFGLIDFLYCFSILLILFGLYYFLSTTFWSLTCFSFIDI